MIVGQPIPFQARTKLRIPLASASVQAGFPSPAEDLYGDMSARVMATLRLFETSMEVYSIDEAFLGLEPWQGETYCRELRAKVRQWTGIPVSVGIASTKTLAKLANRIAKKTPSLQGVFDLTAVPDPDAVLARVPCGDIWGIGRRLAARLTAAGIQTALDLKQADMAWVRRELGVMGERTARELNGVSCLALEEAPDPQKGIATARSFGEPIEVMEGLEEALATYPEPPRNSAPVASWPSASKSTSKRARSGPTSRSITRLHRRPCRNRPATRPT